MTARSISIAAYEKHIESGKRDTQWMMIYGYLDQHYPTTRSELSEQLNIRMSSVCGRVNELMKAGMVQEYERRKCRVTGEQAHPVGLNNPEQRMLI